MSTYVFPGQGSQTKGMGAELFDEFCDLTSKADQVLGYSIKELCLEDPDDLLRNTQYTQPALFVVNAMMYLKKIKETGQEPDFVAGHSLGEYNALFASGAIDFETGLKLVKRRGELMALEKNGAMAAVLRWEEEKIREALIENKLDTIDIANYNSPGQIVISGLEHDIDRAIEVLAELGARCVKLNVSGAFHSRYMKPACDEFTKVLEEVSFGDLKIPVISNVTARPHEKDSIKELLSKQMMNSVKWIETIRYLMGQGEETFTEIGPGNVLTGLCKRIQRECEPLIIEEVFQEVKECDFVHRNEESKLGDESFKQEYNLDYAYVQGAIGNGIASKEMVVSICNNGFLGILDTDGIPFMDTKQNIFFLKKNVKSGRVFGVNYTYKLYEEEKEKDFIAFLLANEVTLLEISNYLHITKSLVKYRLKGLKRESDGKIIAKNRILCKVDTVENAKVFLQAPPAELVNELLSNGEITKEEAEFAKEVPIVSDICVYDYAVNEGGNTSLYILSALLGERDKTMETLPHASKVRIGISGVGNPKVIAFMFSFGADFVMTTTLNECTKEADLSAFAKDMLQKAHIQDFVSVPSADLFEFGVKNKVLKKGVLYHAKANKLYEIYKRYNSIDEIDSALKEQLLKKYFKKDIEEVKREYPMYFSKEEIEKAEENAKGALALLCRWFIKKSTDYAKQGVQEYKVDFCISFDAELGAFNEYVKDTPFYEWQSREVAAIAKLLMEKAEKLNEYKGGEL